MSNVNNPIDDLIDQIDDGENSDICVKCVCHANHLFNMSCGHLVCMACIETLIDENNYKACPSCHNILTKNLHKLYSDFLADPVAKLSYFHNINIGDILWLYGGNSHNWLYSKEHCDLLNEAFENYETSNDSNVSTKELQIQMETHVETYVINFDTQKQYPKNTPDKKRNISSFTFNSLSDLKKKKIIGIAGKLL